MVKRLLHVIIYGLFLFSGDVLAQGINSSEELKKSIDKDVRQELLVALDSLVKQIKRNDVDEKILWQEERQLTKVVFKEVYSFEKIFLDSTHSVSNLLLNCYPLGDGQYLNQIAYFKEKNKNGQSLQMLLTVISHVEQGKITFSTPLSYYTKAWKQQQVANITYLYRDSIKISRAKKFAQKNIQFAKKFGKKPQALRFFMVENYQEILRLLGFDYNASSIGKLRDGYGVIGDNLIFSVMNNEDFSHDLFHYYSSKVNDWSVRNWIVEEGLAYSWGNAYYIKNDGEMAEQKELVEILQLYLSQNKGIDLLKLFENNFWSDRSGIYENIAADFKVGRLISSLICDEVERKHGTKGVNQLLTLGSKPNQFTSFFKGIDKLIGINRDNFNKKVRLLIESYE